MMEMDVCLKCNQQGLPIIYKDSAIVVRRCIHCGIYERVTEEMKQQSERTLKQ